MGTRNSTIVKLDGGIKVAQYGQWDGYPTGQGQTIVEFLKTVDLPKFKKQVKKLTEWKKAEIKEIYRKAGARNGMISMNDGAKIDEEYPELCRNYGAGILELIHSGKVNKVSLDKEFKDDTLFCEYCYEINLDNETISMNEGKKYTFKQWIRKGLMEKLEEEEEE